MTRTTVRLDKRTVARLRNPVRRRSPTWSGWSSWARSFPSCGGGSTRSRPGCGRRSRGNAAPTGRTSNRRRDTTGSAPRCSWPRRWPRGRQACRRRIASSAPFAGCSGASPRCSSLRARCRRSATSIPAARCRSLPARRSTRHSSRMRARRSGPGCRPRSDSSPSRAATAPCCPMPEWRSFARATRGCA